MPSGKRRSAKVHIYDALHTTYCGLQVYWHCVAGRDARKATCVSCRRLASTKVGGRWVSGPLAKAECSQ